MAEIFISYARSDRERAQALAKALEQKVYSVWWDPQIPPGKTFDEVIADALGNAKCVVVLWSKESVKSEWVKEEASVAKRRKILVPALIEDVELPLGFGLIQAADLTDWEKGKPHSDFDSMIEAIAAIVGRPPAEEPGEDVRPKPSLPITEPHTKPATPKPEVPEPEPDEPKPSVTKPTEPPKRKHIPIIGGAMALLLALVIGALWYPSYKSKLAEQAKMVNEIDYISRIVSNLEKEVERAKTLQELEALISIRDTLTRQVSELEDKATELEMQLQLQALLERLVLVGRQLAGLERQLVTAGESEEVKRQPEPVKTGRLFVQTEPENARVRILNIIPPYERGMELKPGRYHVEVTAKGYEDKRQWIELAVGEDKQVNIRLAEAPVTEPGATREEVFTNSIGMKFVLIPAGTFKMGSYNGDLDEMSVHAVTLTKPFYMQTTEVTQRQWKKVMGNNPSYFKNCGDDCPVEIVSWYDVQRFIGKFNQMEDTDKYRLPKEAEWEYAARAGSRTEYCFGDDESGLGEYAWYYANSEKRTHPVGRKEPNAWGLYDMHGNVWEWCQDWYDEDYYSKSPERDPKGPSNGKFRVLRGGSWASLASDVRSASRERNLPEDRSNYRSNLGLRVARTP